jgi:hypothetical protein
VGEAFLRLSHKDRADALGTAAFESGRPADLLEKDVWVVWSLDALFRSPCGEHLRFKGGTSLSKVFGAITRFSEDIDVTYDIRALLPDMANAVHEPLPASRSQEKKWSGEVRRRLPEWVRTYALPLVQARLAQDDAPAEARVEEDRLYVRYQRVADSATEYVRPEVMVEFGARSTGEPAHARDVVCDASRYLKELAFPTARPLVMDAERTFWEKATAVHVFCCQARLRGERYARHWYDLVRLDDAGIAQTALADRELARVVAQHKGWFFPEKDALRQPIDYATAVEGALRLVPDGAALDALAQDYALMIQAGLLEEAAPSFDEIMRRCRALEDRANQ